MKSSANKRAVAFKTAGEDKHEIQRPSNKFTVYKYPIRKEREEHEKICEVYERSQPAIMYDSNIVKEAVAQSDRYKNLRATVVFEMLMERHRYEYLKKIAISHLVANLKTQFIIFCQVTDYNESEAKPCEELSHSVFSWKLNDFLARRKLRNFVWVDISLRMDQTLLYSYKFLTDLNELQSFLEKIFDGLFSHIDDENVDIYEHIDKRINEANQVLHTIDHIEDEFNINYKELKHLLYKEYFFTNAKRDSEDRMLKAYLQNRIWNSHIWDPIEVRYQLNSYRNTVKQTQLHMEESLAKYRRDIAHYNKLSNMEMFVNGSCMDYWYSSIESYKNRLTEHQYKFDKELEEMENKVVGIRKQTDKLREQHKLLSEQIERFHDEEQEIRLQIEKEVYREQQERQKEATKMVGRKGKGRQRQKQKRSLAKQK